MMVGSGFDIARWSSLAAALLVGYFVCGFPGPAAAQSVLFEENFENGWNGWYADNGVWGVGTATVGPVGSGNVAGTILNGNYPYGAFSRLISPELILPESPLDGALWLRFSYWFNLHTSDGLDVARLQIRTKLDGQWQAWGNLSGQFWGYSPYWSEYMADLAPFAGDTLEIAFLMDDEDGGGYGSSQHDGIYLDHVVVREGGYPQRSLQTFDLSLSRPWEGWLAEHTDWEGWYAENGCWQVGESSNAHSGRCIAATNLNSNYSYAASSRFISPPYDLPGEPADGELWLTFWSLSSMASSDGLDYGQVQIQVDGGAWETLLGDFTYWAACWAPCTVDISAHAGHSVRLAFLMVDVDGGGYGSSEASGWYLDDIAIKEGRRWLNNVEDCEGTLSGWGSRQGLWQMGRPTSGPGAAHSGDNCWGTRLGGNYGYGARSTLESTWITVPADSPGNFCFWHWFSFSTSDGTDYGELKILDANGELLVEDFTGASGGWSRYCLDLAPFAGQAIRVRFRMVDVDGGGYGSSESSGWYIDDFEFTGLPQSTPTAPDYFELIQATDPPDMFYYANPANLEQVCIYYMHDEPGGDAQSANDIPDLGNRLAVLPAGFGQFVDEEHPGGNRRYYCITGIDALGHESRILGPAETGVEEPGEPSAAPRIVLHGAQPNPFNPSTELRFRLSQPGRVNLNVFDSGGRLVARLLDEAMPAGEHTVPFAGNCLPSGIYLARLEAGGQTRTCKAVLLK